mgnify:FL=1
MSKKLIRNAIRTPDGTVLETFARHDYKCYKDANGKEYIVDGGLEYIRRTIHEDQVDLSLYDDEPHEIQRDVMRWGTYGIDGTGALTFKKISEMETAHLEAVLDKCSPKPVIMNCMIEELKTR